jgi:hypothetical protein
MRRSYNYKKKECRRLIIIPIINYDGGARNIIKLFLLFIGLKYEWCDNDNMKEIFVG